MSGVFALIIVGLCLLTAWISSDMVLWPLREAMESIEELEIESAKISEPRPVNVEMQSIAQRLRELGRRFAGNRTEIEAIRDQLQQVVGSLSERVLLLDRERRVIMASPEAEKMLSGGAFTLRGQRLSEALSHSHPISALTERAYQTGQSLQEVATFSVNGAGQQAVVASAQIFEDRGQPAGALLTLRDFETLQRLETQLDSPRNWPRSTASRPAWRTKSKTRSTRWCSTWNWLSAKLDAGLDPKPHVDILMSEVNRLKQRRADLPGFHAPRGVETPAYGRERADARSGAAGSRRARPGHRYGRALRFRPADHQSRPRPAQQAILNIIINGCQVMPQGVDSRRDRTRRRKPRLHRHHRQRPRHSRRRARQDLQPLLHHKPKGSGIGLAQAFRAVQLHNGRIKIESEVGAGACFRLILPSAS